MRLSVRAGLAGVASAAAALGVAEVVAVATGPLTAPLPAVGGVVIDSVPAPVKDFGIAVFGVHDKTALIVGTSLLLAAYAYLVGVLALRRWSFALAGIGLFAAVGVAAAVTRHDAGWTAVLPTLVGAAVAVPLLRHLLSLAAPAALDHGGAAAQPETPWSAETPWAADSARTGDSPRAADTAAAAPAGSGVPAQMPIGGAGTAVGDPAGGEGLPALKGVSDGGPAPGPGSAAGREVGEGPAAGSRLRPYDRESRRVFLRRLGIVAGLAAVSGVAGRWLTARRAVTEARAQVVLPAAQTAAVPVPPGTQAPGAVSYVTANRDFYRIDTALYPPQIDPANWELRIHGMVRNPITITWEQLLQRPMVQRHVTLACVSNEVGGDLIGNALWQGTPIKALLEEAQPLPGADQVVQRSMDGWTCGSPTAVLMDGRDALLAIGMNGEPLPIEHGFPVRMVVPGLYGYVSACKWITEIELTRFADFDAYWVPRGWSAQAPIKTESRIDTPRNGAEKPAGPIVVAGVAWAQHRGITAVEVQIDEGPWAPATLADTVSADTWRQWSYRWDAAPGKHTVRVRATDTGGEPQTAQPASPAPDGATGYHVVDVVVR